MPIPLPVYAQIKDNYCLAYFGNNKEILIQLKLLRPFMENTFPGVKVFIACREDALYLLKNEERIISKNELKESKNMFGYIRELLCDMQTHPVEEFMKESDIPYGPICNLKITDGNCVLLTNGIIPVKPLNGSQIKQAIEFCKQSGQEPIINGSIEKAGWVVGVECDQLYQAAALGIKTTLIPTGFGENLFKKMFPDGQILRLKE